MRDDEWEAVKAVQKDTVDFANRHIDALKAKYRRDLAWGVWLTILGTTLFWWIVDAVVHGPPAALPAAFAR